MAEKQQHRHHLFHRHKDGEQENPSAEVDYEKNEKRHKHMEQLGALGAVAAGAYALVRSSQQLVSVRCVQ
jgi:hypothetical protein